MNVCVKCRGEPHFALHMDARFEMLPACPEVEREKIVKKGYLGETLTQYYCVTCARSLMPEFERLQDDLNETEFGNALFSELKEVREEGTQ